jgi:hypothetical protein
MITVYQIMFTANDAARYNEGCEVQAIEARRKLMFGASKFDSSMLKYFNEAYKVYSDDLEEAFELTNLFNDQTKIDVIGDNPTSASVGDIFRKNERFYMVDNFGFKELRLFDDEVATLEGWELV